MKDMFKCAQENLALLRNNEYPGRGIIVGLDESGRYLVQVYWIMGRSESSRGRTFVLGKHGRLTTELIDPSRAEQPELLTYDAMLEQDRCYAVSNGQQTLDTLLYAEAVSGFSDPGFMEAWQYEPDGPHFTPRISAASIRYNGAFDATFSILRRSPFGDACEHAIYQYPRGGIACGYGRCVTTYEGNGDPLPSFEGGPYLLPLPGTARDILDLFWETLNPENKISLGVKFVDLKAETSTASTIEIVNKYQAATVA